MKRPDGDSSEPRYARGNPIYGVLACVDEYQLCNATDCWPLEDRDNAKSRSIIDPAYWHMHLTLERSNIYDATAKRLGGSLVASRMLSQYSSPGLATDHWKTEATHWFGTSLARIQFDAWSIATGEGHDIPTYYEATPDVVKEGRLCGRFKFKNPKFTNISPVPLIIFVLMPLYTFIFHCKTADISHYVRCRLFWKRFGACKRHAGLPSPETANTLARGPEEASSAGTNGNTVGQAHAGRSSSDRHGESSTIAVDVEDGNLSAQHAFGTESDLGNGNATARARRRKPVASVLETRDIEYRHEEDDGETVFELLILRPTLWAYKAVKNARKVD